MARPYRRVAHKGGGKMLTDQSSKEAADINAIVRKFMVNGVAPGARGVPTYGDFSLGVDYHGALNQLRDADASFMDLPSEVRKACDNDPGKFLDKIQDPEARKWLEEMGLVPEHLPAEVVQPVPAPPEGAVIVEEGVE